MGASVSEVAQESAGWRMPEVVVALARALRSMAQPRLWGYVLAPALLAFAAWIILALLVLDRLVARLLDEAPLTWITGLGAVWLAKLLAVLGAWAFVLAAATVSATVLAALFVLPLVLRRVSAREYADLSAAGRDSTAASTWNSVSAVLLFALGWLVSLPLWLIPGGGLLVPVFWLAWFNRRTFAFDALAVHASDAERRALLRQHRLPLLALGGVLALLAHIPLLGLLVPTLAVLAYIHYCLEALRCTRREARLTIIVEEDQ